MIKSISENNILKPWLNNDIIRLIRFKQYLYNEYKNVYSTFNVYDRLMRSLKRGIDSVKLSCIGNKFLASQDNSKKMA